MTRNQFLFEDQSIESNFRSMYLFGRNVATYKFAFAKTLLELGGQQKSFVTLEDLSPVFAKYMLEHIGNDKRQITSASSKFISALNLYKSEQITWEQLLTVTEKIGFNNVIDAFHHVPNLDITTSFYEKSVQGKSLGITLTDDGYALAQSVQKMNMYNEIEGRWNLVENAWTEKNALLAVNYDVDLEQLYFLKPMTAQSYMMSHERIDLTSVRKPLNGYQKGKCFYCFKKISIQSNEADTCDVDHVIPLSTQYSSQKDLGLNDVWNLVLACQDCNRGQANGKFARLPEPYLLERLQKRNEYLIESNHPLKETIIMKCGKTPEKRWQYMKKLYEFSESIQKGKWQPKLMYDIGF